MIRLLRESAEAGSDEGMYALGMAYHEGRGVPQNDQDAATWILKAAGHGNARAMYASANIYRDGIGVQKDPAEALSWCRKAADMDFEPAKEMLKELEQK